MAYNTLTLNALKLTSALIIGAALPITALADIKADTGPETPYEAAEPDMQNHTPQAHIQSEPMPGRADYFAAADLDASGTLSRDEYAILVDTLADGGDSDMIAVRDTVTVAQAFLTSDTDGDGFVTYEELMMSAGAAPEQVETPEADLPAEY